MHEEIDTWFFKEEGWVFNVGCFVSASKACANYAYTHESEDRKSGRR